MNRDDVIRMARQAGMKACCGRTDKSGKHHPTINALFSTVPVQWLEQFAVLVLKERKNVKPRKGEQPEALRIAGILQKHYEFADTDDAASELFRLHQSEQEGWRYASELEEERKRLESENASLQAELAKYRESQKGSENEDKA